MSDGPLFVEPSDGAPLPFAVTDAPDDQFRVPQPEPEVVETPRVESGDGVTNLLDRARKRGPSASSTPRADKKEKTEKRTPPIPTKGFAPGIEKTYMMVGAMILPFDPVIGTTIVTIAPDAAKALDELARQNPAFRRVLVNMMQTTVVGTIIAAHAPLIAVIAQKAMKDSPQAQVFQMFNQPTDGQPTP